MRLTESHQQRLSGALQTSDYGRDQTSGVVHLGVGAFHRAHQAVYFDRLMALGESGWMITGASLRSRNIAEKLNPQNGLFCVQQLGNEPPRTDLIRSLHRVIFAPAEPEALVKTLAHSNTQLVTLTITEKGYCLDPESGDLMWDHPDIQNDLECPDSPKSAIGFLCAALRVRQRLNQTGFTVLSCDNLSNNGGKVRNALLQFASELEPGLRNWISNHVAFPSSMVDRIVPATEPEDLTAFSQEFGIEDHALVKTESFSQWVIEDQFSGLRPPLEKVGVQFTSDIAPWEKAKLRMLNSAHSVLAYIGYLMGYKYVHEAISDTSIRSLVDAVWDEAQSTLTPINGLDPDFYRAELLTRFSNRALRHQTYQIAMDGSQKIPQRFLESIIDRSDRGQGSPALCFVTACWIRWLAGIDENGAEYLVQDPLAAELRGILKSNDESAKQQVSSLIKVEKIFSAKLSADVNTEEMLQNYYSQIREIGLADALQLFIQTA